VTTSIKEFCDDDDDDDDDHSYLSSLIHSFIPGWLSPILSCSHPKASPTARRIHGCCGYLGFYIAAVCVCGTAFVVVVVVYL